MSSASWIAIYFAILLPFILRARRNRRACGSSEIPCLAITWIAIAGVLCFFLIKNHAMVTSIVPPTFRIPGQHVLQRIAQPRITPPTLRITTRPMVFQNAALNPTTQVSNLWIENWSEFINTTHWTGFRAESSDTCVTEAEARQQAIENAASTLSQLAVAHPAFAADARSRDAILPGLKSEISAHLQSGEFIADQVVRKVEKSYGTLYKSYLLIDAPNSTVGTLSQFARDALSLSKTNEMTTWASTAGLFLIILLLYAFLNAATKGYFVWKLRAAALMAVIMGVLAFFAWGS